MAVRKVKGSWWVDFMYNHERLRKRSPHNSKGSAEAFEATLRQLVAQHGSIEGALAALAPKCEELAPTLNEFIDRWLRDYVDVNNKPSERNKKRRVLRLRLQPVFGTLPLDAIGSAEIERYKGMLQERGLSGKTINNSLTILRKCLVTAVDWHIIQEVPRFKFCKVQKPRIRVVPEEDVELLLAACPPVPWRAIVLTAIRTGLRINELIALEWPDLDLDAAVLNVNRGEVDGHVGTPKTEESVRSVPLTSDVVKALRELPRCHTRVFTYQGRSITYYSSWWHLAKACRNAGISHTSWHPLRHTFATDLCSRGADIKAVKDLLGHTTLSMTLRYTHRVTAAMRSAVALLEPAGPQGLAAGCQPEPFSWQRTSLAPSASGSVYPLYQAKTPHGVAVSSSGSPRGNRTSDPCADPSLSDPIPRLH